MRARLRCEQTWIGTFVLARGTGVPYMLMNAGGLCLARRARRSKSETPSGPQIAASPSAGAVHSALTFRASEQLARVHPQRCGDPVERVELRVRDAVFDLADQRLIHARLVAELLLRQPARPSKPPHVFREPLPCSRPRHLQGWTK